MGTSQKDSKAEEEKRRIEKIRSEIISSPNELNTFLQSGVGYANETRNILREREGRNPHHDDAGIVGMLDDQVEYKNDQGAKSDPTESRINQSNSQTTSSNSNTSVDPRGNKKDRKDSSSIDEGGEEKKKNWFLARLHEDLDSEDTTFQLACQAGLTGYIDLVVYVKSSIWSGYITGTMVQLAQSIAQYMLPNAERNPLQTLERAIVIVSFFLGSFVGNQIGKRMGHRNRHYLMLTTFLQSCLIWGASGILLSRPESEPPTFTWWPAVMMFCALSFGMQSIAGQKMISPAFATTVAFTATMTQIASDPYLFVFSLKPSARKNTVGRNRRLIAVVSLMTGAGVGEMVQYSSIGTRGALAVGAAVKLVLAVLWLVPKGYSKKPEGSKA